MAEKKSWRDYTSAGTEEKEDKSDKKTSSWRDYYNQAEIVGKNVTGQLNAWLNNHNNYVSDYQKRFSGRKGTYEDSYVSDSSDWLNSATERRNALDQEANSILSYLDQYGGHLDSKWVQQVRNTINNAKGTQYQIHNSATKDNEYWSGFGSEELVKEYGSAEEAYKYYQFDEGNKKKYNGMSSTELLDAANKLGAGAEKDWLTQYASSVDYDEKRKYDVATGEAEIAALEKELFELDDYIADSQEILTAYYGAEYDKKAAELFAQFGGTGSGAIAAIEEKKKQIAEKKKYLDSAKSIQKLLAFESVTGNKDFGEKSQYVSNVEYGLFGKPEFADNTYAYVNNPTVEDKRPLGAGEIDARTLIGTTHDIFSGDTPLKNRDSSYEREALEYINPEEVAIYNYYYATEGPEKAREYLDLLVDTYKDRKNVDTVEKTSAFANEHPVLSSVLSVGTSLGSGFEYIGDVIEYGGDKLLGKDSKLDTNESALVTNAVRNTVADKVDWEIGNWDAFDFLYNTTMSGVDSFASTAFGGLGGAVLGLSAAAQGTNDALERGMSDGQAFWNGLFSGVFEGLFETVSIGQFKALKDVPLNVGLKNLDKAVVKDLFKNLGKTMLVNATEEMATEIANIAYDTLLNGEFANYTIEELENGAWKQALNQVIESGASGALMGLGFGAIGNASAHHQGVKNANEYAFKNYGGNTESLIKEGLESNVKSDSYKLATKYQQQVQGKDGKGGKALTGQQIRNLLAANQEQITPKDMQKIQKAAEKRLTELGQTEDVSKLAELATRYATGQKLSKAEKNFLASSKYGSRVYNELLPKNIASGDYATEWAEEIGTKQVNATAYNKKAIRTLLDEMAKAEDPNAYKSLESRMEDETPAQVSDTGKAVVRTTGDEIDLTNPTFKQITEDGVVLDVNGKPVRANEIDYDSEDQGLAINAIGKIEHITPATASALYAKLDMTKPVMGQLNGMDEAFTYGYYNYSEADLKAGLFASNLTKEQQNDAYKLGQYVAKNTVTDKTAAIKNMRTAADAIAEKASKEGKTAPKSKNLTITYNHGNGVIEDIETAEKKLGKLNKEQRAGIEVAKILHQMGIGTSYEFFNSYYSKTLTDEKGNPAEVFINDQGQEEAAYAGIYFAADGKIRINLNAYSGTKGLTLNALSHELTHFIKTWSLEKYTAMAEFLVKSYGENGVSMHQLVLKEQARLKGILGTEVEYGEAYDEVVANAFNRMLEDGKVMDRIAEIRQFDKSLADKIIECIRNFINLFTKEYQKNKSLFHETEALMEMKEVFEQLQNMFAEALVDASANFQASLIAKEAGLEVMPVEDVTQYSYQSLAEAAGFSAVENANGTRSFVRDGQAVSEVTIKDIENSPIGAFINFSLEMGDISEDDAKKQKKMFADICTMACKTNDFAMTMQFVGSAVFTGMKANADKQYGTTYDFPSICTKTQAVIDAMSAKMVSLGRGLNTDEIVQLYADVFASGNPVPCPECYVFSRWIGIGGLLDNIKKYQDYYGDMAVEDVAAEYRKMKAEVSKFADEQGISFGKAKGALTSKLTKEFNKLTEKIEKAQNQGEKVKPADLKRLEELEPMMNTVKGMTWLENVYFADSSLKKVNPKFRVPNEVLFDLNNGEAFASQYKDAWAFRTTQGAGYGKAITPYAESRLGEGVLVTNNTTNAIKGKAQGSLDNYFLNQMGKLDKKSRDALKRARLKQKIQAFIGGQRFQSTSDARYENASDYLLAALEMQAMSGMVQCYTKVDGAVPAFSAWGFSINQSLMPLNGGLDADGNVKDTSVGGMKPSVAFENRKKHESAGTITIGVNDNHIRAMFKQLVRDFIIPYHASGGKADVVAEFRRIQEGKEAKGKAVRSTDYSRTQSDKILSDEVLSWQGKTDAQIQRIHEIRNARIAILTGGKVNMTVVRSNRFLSALYDKLNGGEWDGVKLAKSKVESQIFPNEFWDQTVTYEESAKITKDYLEYCEDLGFLHRFSGMVPSNGKLVPVNGYNENGERVQLTDLAYKYDADGNKTAEVEEFFWKVLTDRRMYDNNGNYLAQKIVTLNDTTTETVIGFAKNNQGREYDKAKAETLAKKILDNSSLNGENSSKQKGGKVNDNRGIREGVAQATEVTGTDRGRYSDYSGTAQEKKSWQDLSSADRKRVVDIVDNHIAGSKNYEEILDLLSHMVGRSADDISVSLLKKAIRQISEKIYSDATTMHPVIFENTWSMLGGSITGLYRNILATAQKDSDTGEVYSSQETDRDYMDAVSRGDMETAQKMVDKAAKTAGYTQQAYHGTGEDFNIFSEEKIGGRNVWGKGFYFGTGKGIANDYATWRESKGGKYRIVSANLKMENPYINRKSSLGSAQEILDKWFPDMWNGSRELGLGYIKGKLENSPHDLLEFIADHNKIEIRDVLKSYGYDSIMDGGELVVFSPTQIKSNEPVVWDDKGKVIPLSERFNQDNKDIRYSTQQTDNITNRHLLAGAFEGITQNSVEYKMLQDYKGRIKDLNALEKNLSDLNAEIRQIRFGTTGQRDTARLTQLENKAKVVASEINRHDKKLLSLEASEPLRKVLQRERKKEAQKTKDHVKEIQQNKKVRAEQTELRHKIRKAIRDLDKILNRGNKKLNVKDDLQPVVTKALQAAEILFTDNYGNYDMLRNGIGADLSDAEEALVESCAKMLKDLDKMPTDGYENFQARQEAENRLKTKMSKLNEVFARERKRLNNTKVSSILGELADAYASLEKSKQSYVQGAYSEAVHNFLKNLQSEVGGTIVMDMTKDQLESVYAAYKMVLTTVRKANQMFNEELKLTREQLGNAVIQEVLNAGGVHLLGTKLGDAISQFDWNNMKPIWLANRVGSETFGKLVNGLFKGQYNFAVDIDEAKQFKLEMDKKYKPRNWDAEKQYEFRSSTGKEFSLNLQQIMSLYAFSKREQAYSHLLNGGFVFEDNSTVVVDGKLGIKKTYIHKGAASYKLNEATLNGIINSLTKEQKAYVDEMQKYLSDVMGAKGNDVSMQLYGIKMFNEQFYFPLRSSGAYMERAKEAELKKQQGQINLVNSGFTHSVKPEAKNPIVLSGFMDVWAEHCNEMSMYHSMVLPMEDFRKVYNYTTIHDEKMESASVYQTIQDAYGKAATNYIDQLYRELNAGATVDPREAPFKRLISNFKKAAVMLSGSVVVQQFSSIGRAYDIIDPKYFTGAKVNSDTNLSVADEMKKYAPVAIIKEIGGFDTGTKGSAKSYIMAEQYGNGERFKAFAKDEQFRGDIMGYLPAKADKLTWSSIWEAVKRETKAKNPKMDVKSEEFLKLAGERFSEVIEKTQVYDSVLARSANMRSKGNFMAMATAFMAEPTTTVNLLEDAIRSGKANNIARAFGSVAVSIVLNNALASIVYAMRDDDDDETFLEKYFQSFTSGMIDDINPMSYYPFLKDVYSLFQGYDVERSDMSVIADVRDALKRVVSLLGKDTSGMDDDELADYYKQVNEVFMGLLDAGCSMFGVPVKNVRRDAMGIINAWNTVSKDLSGERNTTWLSFWDKVGAAAKDTIPIYAWTKDESKADKLYRVIISGDTSYLTRLKSTYKTDSAYQSAVRKALRENDPRIQEAAQARYEGKTEEYKRIFREIQKEGKFSFDDIMSAINTELSKLEPDKATSEYSARGFVEAVAMGNTSEANAMRDDIIATHIANGKTEAEAEAEFASAVSTGIHHAYSSGLLDEAGAEKMLMEYADKDEEEAASKVAYWAFCDEHPGYDFSESNVNDYLEFAEPTGISLDVYEQFIKGTKGLETIKDEWGDVEVTKREQVLEVIDSLPLTWQQKDALYLAAGYAENKIWDVPW